MSINKTISALILSLSAIYIQAQHITSQQWHGTFAGTMLHPGVKLEKKVNIILPDFTIGLQGKDFTVDKYLTELSDGKYFFDENKIGVLERKTLGVKVDNNLQTFGLAVKVKDFHLMLGHRIVSKVDVAFSTDLLEIGLRGNGDYLNQTMSLGPDANAISYNAFSIGFQKSWTSLTIGANANILVGVGALITEKSKFDLTTKDFEINIDSDFLIKSSNGFLQYNGIDSIDSNLGLSNVQAAFSGNSGFGIDIGASYSIGDRAIFTAGITDIGKITWDTDAKSYSSSGKFSYTGLDILPLLKSENIEYNVEDSIRDFLQIKVTTGDFSTTLRPNFILSGSYKLSDKWSFHGMASSNGGFTTRLNQITVSAVRKLWVFDLGLHYGLGSNMGYDNLGASLRANLGPVKIYGSVDSVLALANPLKADGTRVRFGLAGHF